MKSIEIEWDGKKEQVLYEVPLRQERKEYIKKLSEFRKQLKVDNPDSEKVEEAIEFREDFALSKVKKAPFDIAKPDIIPLDILRKLTKTIEKEMVLDEDFTGGSSTVQPTGQP